MSTAVKLQFAQSVTDGLEAWQDSIRVKAIHIIQETLPNKILSLNDQIAQIEKDKAQLLSKANYFDTSRLDIDVTVHEPSAAESSSKKRKAGAAGMTDASANGVNPTASDGHGQVYTGVVKSSQYFARAFDELRAGWDELIELMDALKMYINLQMPQIEDGDTFGVSVQEEALNEVVRTQDSAYNLLATPFTYYSTRGELAAKLVRYPGVEDYQQALREHDRKSIYRLKMHLTDMRNMYAVVFDILKKNITKISKPKSGNQMGSYG